MSRSAMMIEGLPVRDLTKPLKLVISDDDCKRGSTKNPSSCAAALAACRLPKVTEARVHIGRVFLNISNKYWLRGKTPGALRTEIVSFDRGAKFEPGEYTIRPIAPSERKDRHKKSHVPVRRGGKRHVKILKNLRGTAHTEYGGAKKAAKKKK